MRTINRANQNKKDGFGEKTKANQGCLRRLEEYGTVEDVHSRLVVWPKASVSFGLLASSVPDSSLNGNRVNNQSDFMLRGFHARQVVLRTGSLDKTDKPPINRSGGRILTKSNSLPPIFDSRLTSTKLGAKILSPNQISEHKALQMGKKTNILAISFRRHRAFSWRPNESARLDNTVNLICRSFATLTVAQNSPEPGITTPNTSAGDQSRKKVLSEENKANAKDSGIIRDGIEDSRSVVKTKRPTQELSDSAIETEETLSSHRNEEDKTGWKERSAVPKDNDVNDEEQEEYYSRQRIIEWIIGVNASLFSTSKDEFNKGMLKEEDVDTIKIVYGQD